MQTLFYDLDIVVQRKTANINSSLVKGISPSIKNSEKAKLIKEYIQPFSKQINLNQLYKVGREDQQDCSEVIGVKPESKNGIVSYFGIEVSVMNLRPQTEGINNRVSKSKVKKLPSHHQKWSSSNVNLQTPNPMFNSRLDQRKVIYQANDILENENSLTCNSHH